MRFPFVTLIAVFSLAAPARMLFAKDGPQESAKEGAKDAPPALPEKDERKFRETSREYAKYVFPVRDNFVVVHPSWNGTAVNTWGLSRQAMADQLVDYAETSRRAGGGLMVREKTKVSPNKDDVAAACSLRALAPGEFGALCSVRIKKIIDRNEALVDSLRLYDQDCRSAYGSWREGGENQKVGRLWKSVREAQDRMTRIEELGYWNQGGRICRLVGFSAADFREGEVWRGAGGKGIRIAVGWTERAQIDQYGRKKDIPVLVLVNVDKLTKSVDAKGFEAFLEARKAGKADFLAILKAATENNPGSTSKVKAAVLWDLAMLGGRDVAAATEVAEPTRAVPAPISAMPVPAAMPARAAPVVVPAPAPARPERPPGTPIFEVDKPASGAAPMPAPTQTPVASPAPAMRPRYVLAPVNEQVEALLDLTRPEVATKLVIGHWRAKDFRLAPFIRECAADGTYKEFDAAGRHTGGGEYRVTGKCAIMFIGAGKNELAQFALKSPNVMRGDDGAEYLRVVPAKSSAGDR